MESLTEQRNKILKIIDWVFWSVLGFFCLGYQVFWSNFAELHVRLPFLKFPIFIGEFLLAGSLGLLFWKWKLTGFKLNRWHVVSFVYVGWFFLKALHGYLTFGPLALRNAALFYYPLFAVMTYHFYKPGLFTPKIITALLILFILIKMTVNFAPVYPPFAVFVVLALNVKLRRLKYFFLALTIVLFSYKGFFMDSKTGIISNMLAFLFLIYFLFFKLSRIKLQYKIAAIFLIFMAMVFGFFQWMHKSQLVSLATPQTLLQQFKEADEYIAQRKKKYVPLKLNAHLYNPNSGEFEEGEEPPNPSAQHTAPVRKKSAHLSAREASIFLDDTFGKIKAAVIDAVQKYSGNVSFDIKRTSSSVAMHTKALNLLERTTQLALQEAVQVIEGYKKTALTKSSTLVSQPQEVRMLVKQTTQAAISKAVDRIDEEKEILFKEMSISVQPKTTTASIETQDKKISPPVSTAAGQSVHTTDQLKSKPVVKTTRSLANHKMAEDIFYRTTLAKAGKKEDIPTVLPVQHKTTKDVSTSVPQQEPGKPSAPLQIKTPPKTTTASIETQDKRIIPPVSVAAGQSVHTTDQLKSKPSSELNNPSVPSVPPILSAPLIPEEKLKSLAQKYPSSRDKDLKAKNAVSRSIKNDDDDSKETQKIILANRAVGTINEQVGFLPFSRADFDANGRSTQEERGNMLFRLLLWRDMIEEFLHQSPSGKILGINFGKPQRSISLEIYGQASGEWSRDGWIAPHNSFLHLIYRGGIVGLLVVVGLFSVVGILTRKFVMLKSSTGIWLMSLFVYWMTFSNFLLCLELPYQAIPFWSLLGMTVAYCKSVRSHANFNCP